MRDIEIEMLSSLRDDVVLRKVRRYDKVAQDCYAEYIERDTYVGITVGDFFRYWKMLKVGSEERTRMFTFTNHMAKDESEREVTIDPASTVLYLTDLDMPERTATLNDEYKQVFKLPEILPGGRWCMMNKVS